MSRTLISLFIAVTVIGCAARKPVLYPNDHLRAVGQEAAERDIEACRQLAERAGVRESGGRAGHVAGDMVHGSAMGAASGAVGGAIAGAAGTGAAIGAAGGATAGLLRGLFSKPEISQAYVNFVNKCLEDRGYQPVGWD
jgi:hypothetical protein